MPALTRQSGRPGSSREGWIARGRKIRACVRPVVSCPRRSCTCGGHQRPILPSLLPHLPPLRRRAIGTNATQRNATQSDPTTPSDPDPTHTNASVLSQSEARKARAATTSASLVSVPRVPAGWSLPGDPAQIQLQTDPGQVPPRAPYLIQSVPTDLTANLPTLYLPPTWAVSSVFQIPARQANFLPSPRLTWPGLVRTCLPARPHQPRPTIHTRTRSVSSSRLYAALPCPDPASHFCTLHAAPRRATCLPTSTELRGTHTVSQSHR